MNYDDSPPDESNNIEDLNTSNDEISLVDEEENLTETIFLYEHEYSRNVLIQQIFETRWTEAIFTCQINPELARRCLSNYGTPLHCALSSQQFLSYDPPPAVLVNNLISAYPDALTMRDFLGDVPLHLVCGQSFSEEIFKTILKHNPQAALTRNFEENLPLHNCWRLYNISAILEIYPSLLVTKDGTGKSIIETYLKLWRVGTNKLKPYRLVHLEYFRDIHICGDTSHTDISIIEVLRILLYLFRISAYKQKKINDEQERVSLFKNYSHDQYSLHACLTYSGCPFDFIRSVIKLMPNQAFEADKDGNFPLHLAAQLVTKDTRHWRERQRANTMYQESRKKMCLIPQNYWHKSVCMIVHDLIEINPIAAYMENCNGMLPVELIDQSGARWSAGMMHIIQTNPLGLLKLGLNEKLWPRVLSKISRNQSSNALNTLYSILKEMPEIVKDKKTPRRSNRKRRKLYWHFYP